MVKSLFNEEEARLIPTIPIHRPHIEDCLIWHFIKNRDYIVKFGYHLIIESTPKFTMEKRLES